MGRGGGDPYFLEGREGGCSMKEEPDRFRLYIHSQKDKVPRPQRMLLILNFYSSVCDVLTIIGG